MSGEAGDASVAGGARRPLASPDPASPDPAASGASAAEITRPVTAGLGATSGAVAVGLPLIAGQECGTVDTVGVETVEESARRVERSSADGPTAGSGTAVAEASARSLVPGSGARAARRLAWIAAVRLTDAPEVAEAQLRRAVVVGAGELDGRELAALSTRLVTAVAAQPGRERDLARVAESAARCWEPISTADAHHLWIVAGRAWYRAGKSVEAVAAFDRLLLGAAPDYPPGELALVRAEFAESLNRLGHYRQAAWQFGEAARLVSSSAADRHRHADLVWSAAVARECCGQESEALGGYLRAAGLWGELDKIVPRARCLRAAAWLQLRGPGGRARGPWWVTIEVLLTELNRRIGSDPAAPVIEELSRTRGQFAQMCAQASGSGHRHAGTGHSGPWGWGPPR